jgi:hypothetical protein
VCVVRVRSNSYPHGLRYCTLPPPSQGCCVGPALRRRTPPEWAHLSGMYASPTRDRNGNPATASRNPAEATSPPLGAMESMEAVQNLAQMLLGHGIDSSVPAPGHTGSKIRLPLQYFDNTDVERNTPQGWVEQCTSQGGKRASSQPTAIVLLTDESGVGQWRLGRVFHWDDKSSTYHVHLANALGQIQEDSTVALPRLSVCFLAEPMHEFAQRVAAPQHVHNQQRRATGRYAP